MALNDGEAPLLSHCAAGVVDHKGRPVLRSISGGWKSAGFIIGVEVAERFAFSGIELNLISYLTGPLGQSTASAAANVNVWAGVSSLLPLAGAFIADTFLGRYRTIFAAALLYIVGLGLLSLSAILPSGSEFQVILFFSSLYLVAVAQSGHKPCVQAFGADQFDGQDPKECKARGSFFNWWYFGLCASTLVASLVLSYVQDNVSWALGFGIPCIAMAVGLVVFLLGTRTYRYSISRDAESPFHRVGRVFAAAFRNRAIREDYEGILTHKSSGQYRFLDKALLIPKDTAFSSKLCSVAEVEEAKSVLRLFPIWATCLVFGIVFAQIPTFFTKQGATMERMITPGFEIPPASLQSFVSIGIIVFLPIYDRLFVPIARELSAKPSGVTMLQRIGTGMLISTLSMIIAALVEIKRLRTAEEFDVVDKPGATVPMSVWWLAPQYFLAGIADVFTMVGLQEFFYDQVPSELRSVGLALYLSIFGVGSFLSSFLISIIEEVTGRVSQDSWFSNNLNRAHLDYYYLMLAGMSALAFTLFVLFSRSYIYRKDSV